MAQGTGAFTAADVALLDEIAETILPETSTPGAKAAKTGAFMALMVTDVYTERERQVFREGLRKWTRRAARRTACRSCRPSPAQRLSLVEALDREQKRRWKNARPSGALARARARRQAATSRAHYFRMMKELTLLGYFTSRSAARRRCDTSNPPGGSTRVRRTRPATRPGPLTRERRPSTTCSAGPAGELSGFRGATPPP